MSANLDSDLKFAILIDADNISDKYIKIVLDEVANYGIATYKRIYGDWTSPRLASWKNCLLENSILPMQQYSYTYGKNATDSAMIIDAMDILYSGTVDGFTIVSSDSDFTRLVARLRESGMQVIGMGEQKTPEPFISACNQFKYLDLLFEARKADEAAEEEQEVEEAPRSKHQRKGSSVGRRASSERDRERVTGPHPGQGAQDRRPSLLASAQPDSAEPDFDELSRADRRRRMRTIRTTINSVIDKFSDDEGWLSLGRLGDQLSKRMPDFDVRNYGFKKLLPFLKSLGAYEFDESSGESGHRQIHLRLRQD
ncbi:hypothetical protein Corgl_1019 [Coriobacterium glomerans PW2]|uniref:HTH OST-type domain-containing protein n=1 Tax=Coriobacterium glomerans (strain ATCC 49209 / DSM 20642 / JCM 10262 / PW2) TaxID=700015 RepID=F2N9M4_CORGP|nr:NYN domain-containing protein [Coriobacterium glomerans]AEB07127.1 hypothetical protein Corgl_1019 [Coriobacterium glomerans PW2]